MQQMQTIRNQNKRSLHIQIECFQMDILMKNYIDEKLYRLYKEVTRWKD